VATLCIADEQFVLKSILAYTQRLMMTVCVSVCRSDSQLPSTKAALHIRIR